MQGNVLVPGRIATPFKGWHNFMPPTLQPYHYETPFKTEAMPLPEKDRADELSREQARDWRIRQWFGSTVPFERTESDAGDQGDVSRVR